ncbi:MAG: hypothetical protein IKV03_04380 [Alphaproteobacteria bacterium]|nr:hypothetical protein [Alphaproteobacteria bacterium]
MANQRLIEALEQYTGEADSLEMFVSVATQELGQDWVSVIYDVMADIPTELQERLAHAFNYNAAITAWNELQEYLTQDTPLNYQETMERVPVLEHWLSFFGAVGEEALTQLKDKLRAQGEGENQNTTLFNDPFATSNVVNQPLNEVPYQSQQSMAVTSEQIDNIFSDTDEKPKNMDEVSNYLDNVQMARESVQLPLSTAEEEQILPTTLQEVPSVEEDIQSVVIGQPENSEGQDFVNSDTLASPIVNISDEYRTDVFDPIAVSAPSQNDTPLLHESEESWRIRKMFRQVDFIANIESWISFLCLDLGYTDFYNYRYYGFLVDVLDKTIAELQELLGQRNLYDIINMQRVGGVQFLQNKLMAYQKQSQEAHEMLSDYIPLVREDLSVDDLKNCLGGMDLTGEKEYLGPAPDGFEMIDDPYENMNEDDLKKEYEKIETEGVMSSNTIESGISASSITMSSHENSENTVKNTSQTPQNGVQRKMSFSFGAKTVQRPVQTDGSTS